MWGGSLEDTVGLQGRVEEWLLLWRNNLDRDYWSKYLNPGKLPDVGVNQDMGVALCAQLGGKGYGRDRLWPHQMLPLK